jgi:hypothetical protein
MKSVVFRTAGILDLRAITIFGCSAKPKSSSPIGYFGTGLKYAMAILAREDCDVTIYRGLDEPLKLKVTPTSFRDATLSALSLGNQELPFTTELGKNWKLWQAFRELESNTRDEGGYSSIEEGEIEPEAGYTKIVVTGENFVEVYDEIDTIFLNPKTEDISQDSKIEIYPEPSEHLYYNGIRVYTYNKPAEFTYNITRGVELTENRTIAHWFYIERDLTQALAQLTDRQHIEKLFETSGMESGLDFNDSFNSVSMADEFKEVVIESAPKNHSTRELVERLEKEEQEAEEEANRKSPDELLDGLVESIFEILCCDYIEEPAGRGEGYGISDGGHEAVKELIKNFIKEARA